ncbi:hypothetical protein [Pseudomonas sp.]|uniref:hypothetical protein n=1 Tax=Pseudomonas sp. TaxID=306 RepID=UPI003F3B22C6
MATTRKIDKPVKKVGRDELTFLDVRQAARIRNWKNFAAHFFNYKVCGELPAIFGRDERLDLSDMHHIHLAFTDSKSRKTCSFDVLCQTTFASRLAPTVGPSASVREWSGRRPPSLAGQLPQLG